MLEMIKDMFTDGPLMASVGVLLIICVLALVFLLVYLLYYCIDSCFRPNQEEYGVVVEKTFTAAHTTMVFNAVTKTTMPQFHPDDWSISVDINGLIGEISIDENVYNSLSEGNTVWTVFSVGRLNNRNVYIKSIRK